MTWSPSQYLKFEDERSRPARDLVAAVPTDTVRVAVDLGCGPGNSTEALLARYPQADVLGIDSSTDMVEAARKRLPRHRFEVADIAAWQGTGPYDLLLANASLQWVPDHATLFPSLARRLAEGGTLAVQMPDNLDQPAHRLMRQVAAEGPWSQTLAQAAKARTVLPAPGWYYDLLRPICRRVDIWRTTYHHPLQGAEAVVEWLKGTGLRPFIDPLEPAQRNEYLARYTEAVTQAYPVQGDGMVLLPFPRLFIVATR
ncbi:trans-aconitate 2-methyltransferase [Cupriavidus gilardii J11]|uniref:Trans-aconitate 2-methyltransferase n=1 Tax=Cupriavidus gilardii J11 TaxID=936133 RepID=A0A562BH61_9BURK|nr:trans-aconitate 2-methyltransferase [Cupriavidus gilardii]TWG84230.1 trans-aconitate 2-methyltransferase [Cupriavidus gilardii J11]